MSSLIVGIAKGDDGGSKTTSKKWKNSYRHENNSGIRRCHNVAHFL